MWTKIYLACLALALAVMAFFTVYSLSWLQSIGDPRAAVAGFEYHASVSWPFLWISSIALLVIGNAVLWTTRRSWAMWISFLYIAIFIAVKFFWLDSAFLAFEMANSPSGSGRSFGPLIAPVMIVVIAAIVFFNQFFVVRMLEKMYPRQAGESAPPEEQAPVE